MQQQDINIIAEQFKQDIINTINQAGNILPPALVYYIMTDVYTDIDNTYKNLLKQLKTEVKQDEDLDEINQS